MTSSAFSIDAYCSAQKPDDWTSLPKSTRTFLEAVGLSSVHPLCRRDDDNKAAALHFEVEGVPPMGPMNTQDDYHQNKLDAFVTTLYLKLPHLLCTMEMLLRVLAPPVAAMTISYLLLTELLLAFGSQGSSWSSSSSSLWFTSGIIHVIGLLLSMTSSVLAVASSLVLMTDNLYVLELGLPVGVTLVSLSTLLALRTCLVHHDSSHWDTLLYLILAMEGIVLAWAWRDGTLQLGHSFQKPKIEPGLYYHKENTLISNIVTQWPIQYRTYSDPTYWIMSGDSRTALPFVLNQPTPVIWHRVWLVTEDKEGVALDISFPNSGHDTTKPVFMLLHGINGGSHGEYLKDFAARRNDDGCTVAVMVGRGLMDTPLRGWTVFHSARMSDIHGAASSLRKGLGKDQILAGIGYSMGAFNMACYVTTSGKDCAFDVAMSISGGLDMRYNMFYKRSERVWQPGLVSDLRGTTIEKWGQRYRQRLSKQQMKNMMRATTVPEVDKYVHVAYSGFDSLDHYYSEMSALGDIPLKDHHLAEAPSTARIHNVSIPFCLVHAIDDPVVSWRVTAANDGLMHPHNLTKTGQGNTMVLLVKKGGHLGWPVGTKPFETKWKWMNDNAMAFVQAVMKAKNQK